MVNWELEDNYHVKKYERVGKKLDVMGCGVWK
jgi:hypothetical protein